MRRSSRHLAVAVATLAAGGAVAIPALAATTSVKVGDNYFVKDGGAKVTVKKGTTVKWAFKGKSVHNVTVKSGPAKFHSRNLSSGTYSQKLTKAGTYRIYCTIHGAAMSMTLVVK
jgi:plastocyanin